MIGLIYFLLALGIIVLVHELGHLVVAKRNGVYCHEFSIGMGPKVKTIKTDKTGTVYNLRLIPLGGYVMMAGEENDSESDHDIPSEQLLNNKTPWQRFKILIAGSTMNIALTLFLLILISFFAGIPTTTNDIVVAPTGNLAKVTDKTEMTIAEINGEKVTDFNDISTAITNDNEKTVTIKTDDNQTIKVDKNEQGQIGITPQSEKFKFFGSIKNGVISTIALFGAMIQMIITLFSPQYGVDDLSGPVGIYQMSSQVLDLGLQAAIYWIAYLSINIGVMNLLPIPALDGGRIVFVIYEVITRKKVNKKVENYLIIGSFLVLIGLFFYVTYNDIFRIFS